LEFERICFQIESAHWFYDDFYREWNPQLPDFTLRDFAKQMFQHCPLLQPHAHLSQNIWTQFTNFKFKVPVCGAIILDESLEKCLLVKGWTSKSTWSFPKGKINKGESELHCAIREVFEETGFDITEYTEESHYIALSMKERSIRLYIAPLVPENTHFKPRTRKEISKIEWVSIVDLPKFKDHSFRNGNNYFMVIPFLGELRTWISEHREQLREKRENPKLQILMKVAPPIEILKAKNGDNEVMIPKAILQNNESNEQIMEEQKRVDWTSDCDIDNSFLSFRFNQQPIMQCFTEND